MSYKTFSQIQRVTVLLKDYSYNKSYHAAIILFMFLHREL